LLSFNARITEPDIKNDYKRVHIIVDEAPPLIQSGFDSKPDMMFGWKPEQGIITTAPIPLHYNYCEPLIN